jgi:hypothetical protein
VGYVGFVLHRSSVEATNRHIAYEYMQPACLLQDRATGRFEPPQCRLSPADARSPPTFPASASVCRGIENSPRPFAGASFMKLPCLRPPTRPPSRFARPWTAPWTSHALAMDGHAAHSQCTARLRGLPITIFQAIPTPQKPSLKLAHSARTRQSELNQSRHAGIEHELSKESHAALLARRRSPSSTSTDARSNHPPPLKSPVLGHR